MNFIYLFIMLFLIPNYLLGEEVGGQSLNQETAEESFLEAINSKANLVILAEGGHGNDLIQQRNIIALSALVNKHDFDCLYVELDDVSAPSINAFMSASLSYEDSIGNFVRERGYARNLFPEKIATTARSLRIKVIPVDVDWQTARGKRIFQSIFKPKGYSQTYINERNRIMAQNIRDMGRDNNCTKSILIVGEYHTDHLLNNTQLVPIQSLLAQDGYKIQLFTSTESSFTFTESIGL